MTSGNTIGKHQLKRKLPNITASPTSNNNTNTDQVITDKGSNNIGKHKRGMTVTNKLVENNPSQISPIMIKI